ncbi:MAG TPA: glycosyltransferase, partial [Solirubrobacteraceae bacterium]
MSPAEGQAVAVVAAWYPTPERPMSGVFVRDQARAAARHCRVGVVADAGVSRGGRPYTVARAGGEPFPTFLVRHRWGPAHAAGVLSGLRRLSREGLRPGVVHGHVHQSGLAALLAGRRYRVPVVISEHSSHFSLGTLSAAARRQAKVAFRGADLVCP